MIGPYKKLLSGIFVLCGLFTVSVHINAGTAPEFAIPTDSGKILLNELRGRVVYLDFWASWCVPCKKSFPWFNEVQARYKDKGLVIIAVNMDKDRSEVKKFLKKYPPEFIVAYDPEGDVAVKYQVSGMPSSYLIDRNGDIKLSHEGFRERDKAQLESAITSLLED